MGDRETWLAFIQDYQLFLSAGSLLLGFAAKYWYDLHLLKRQRTLERIDAQVGRLYAPLFALSQASERSWVEFRKAYRPHAAFFNADDPPTPDDLAAWRNWMTQVFFPLNMRMEHIILDNGELIEGDSFPPVFVEFLAHNAAYKAVLAKWEENDFSQHASTINFPSEFRAFVSRELLQLRQRQLKYREEGEAASAPSAFPVSTSPEP